MRNSRAFPARGKHLPSNPNEVGNRFNVLCLVERPLQIVHIFSLTPLEGRRGHGVCLPVHSPCSHPALWVAVPAHAGLLTSSASAKLASEVFTDERLLSRCSRVGSQQNREPSDISCSLSPFAQRQDSCIRSLQIRKGDVLGYEPMSEVVEVSRRFTISCGECFFCHGSCSLCDTSNPNAEVARKAMGRNHTGQKGNFGEGQVIAGERIWNIT